MAWLGAWANRLKVEADYTKVSAALSNFPIMFRFSAASGASAEDLSTLRSYLNSYPKKFAVTTSDGTTQCYVENLQDPLSLSVIVMWVLAPSLSNTANTIFYIYWDFNQPDNDSYVGFVDTKNAWRVYDTNAIFVKHVMQSSVSAGSLIRSNARFATKALHGTGFNVCAIAAGKIYKAYDFEESGTPDTIAFGQAWGASDVTAVFDDGPSHLVPYGVDSTASINFASTTLTKMGYGTALPYWWYSDDAKWDFTGEFTLELWVRFTALPADGISRPFISHCNSSDGSSYKWEFGVERDGTNYNFYFRNVWGGSWTINISANWGATPVVGTWYHVAVSRDSSADWRLYRDGVQRGTTVNDTTTIDNFNGYLYVGMFSGGTKISAYLEQIRISNIARYTGSSFTLETFPHVSDANTLLLNQGCPNHCSLRYYSYFTFECLIKLEAVTTTYIIYHESTDGGDSYPRIQLQVVYISGSCYLQAKYTTTTTGTAYVATGATPLSAGTWYHVAVTVNAATDQLVVWLNGVSDGVNATAKASTNNAASLNNIGIGWGQGGNEFDGLIEEIRIHYIDRPAAFLKATYNATFDTLLTWDAYEEAEGLPKSNIPLNSDVMITTYAGTCIAEQPAIANLELALRILYAATNPTLGLGGAVNVLAAVSAGRPLVSLGNSINPAAAVSAGKPTILPSAWSV